MPSEKQIIEYVRKHKEEFPIKQLRDRILEQGVSEAVADDAIWKALGGGAAGGTEPLEETPEETAEILFKNLLIAVWADGTVDDRERAIIREAAELLDADDAKVRRWTDELRAGPLKILTPRSAAVRSASLDLMIAVCKADEEIDVRELSMLKKVAEHFGLSSDELARRLGTVSLKTVARELGKEGTGADVPAPPPFSPVPAPQPEDAPSAEEPEAEADPAPEPAAELPEPASSRRFRPVSLWENKPLLGGIMILLVAAAAGIVMKARRSAPPPAPAVELPAPAGQVEPAVLTEPEAADDASGARPELVLPEPEAGEAMLPEASSSTGAAKPDALPVGGSVQVSTETGGFPAMETSKTESPASQEEAPAAKAPSPLEPEKKPGLKSAALKRSSGGKRSRSAKKRRPSKKKPRTIRRSKKRLASSKRAPSKKTRKAVPPELKAPAWTAVPAADLEAAVRVELEIVVPPTPVWDEPGLQYLLSGDLSQKGRRIYASRGKAAAVVWASVKGSKDPFALHLPFAWVPEGTLAGLQKISDMAFFALQGQGRSDAAFTEAKPLAVLSGIMSYEEGGRERTFVMVFYGYQLKDTAGGTQVFEGTRTAIWPYDKAFVSAQAQRGRSGTPLREAASVLLSTMK